MMRWIAALYVIAATVALVGLIIALVLVGLEGEASDSLNVTPAEHHVVLANHIFRHIHTFFPLPRAAL